MPARDPRYQQLRDLPMSRPHLPAEISRFFDACKELVPGKSTDARGWQDRNAAQQEISASIEQGRGVAAAGREPLRR